MIKRIVYLVVPVLIFAGIGLASVQNYFSSFPPSKTVIEQFSPAENIPDTIDLTELFFDDSGSMRGYYGKKYIEFLRLLKSHVRERGEYRYYAFSDPGNIIEGDVWEIVENVSFYSKSNTYFDRVLDSIAGNIAGSKQRAKNFIILTDGIQDVSKKQDYSRIVNKVSDVLEADLFFQIIAVKLPFSGRKFPEGGSFIQYEGDSPLYCYIFSYQHDFGKDLFHKMEELRLPVEFLGFGNRNIHASIKKFSDAAENPDGSKSTLRRFKDEIPVTYVVSGSGPGGTLLTNVVLNLKDINIDVGGFRQKTPEFCGKCMPVNDKGFFDQTLSGSVPVVTLTTTQFEPLKDAEGNTEVQYSLYFENRDNGPKTAACDLTFCNWLPVNTPGWVKNWSSVCDNSIGCFEGKTPFLYNVIHPLLNKSLRKYTFGYAVIRN